MTSPVSAVSAQERAVEVKALEWETNGEVWWVKGLAPRYEVGRVMPWGVTLYFGTLRIDHPQGDHYLTQEDAKAAAQADYEQRIRSALVDVPVEPVAWMHTLHMDGGETAVRLARARVDLPWGKPGIDFDASFTVTVAPLYTSPPLPHREGEDSAEAIEAAHVTLSEDRVEAVISVVRQALMDAAHAHRGERSVASRLIKAEVYATNAIRAALAPAARAIGSNAK